MKLITARQQELLEYLFEGLRTFKDMREHLGVTSNQTVLDILEPLVKKGYVENVNGKYVPIVTRSVDRKNIELDSMPNAYAYIETINYTLTQQSLDVDSSDKRNK